MSTQPAPADPWFPDYATLALRVDRALRLATGVSVLDYRGSAEWRAAVEAEEPPRPADLVARADDLLAALPTGPGRGTYLRGQVCAARAVARRLSGAALPLAEFVPECLDVPADPLDEDVLDAAHAAIDAALPGPGPVAERLHRWQDHHSLPPERLDRLPAFVARAVAETRRRTAAIVELPTDEEVGCVLASDVPYRAAGHHAGGSRSTIHVNRDSAFNLADLLYVVAHEGHPGHIAEQVLKERHLVRERGHREQEVRFMLSPHHVISEGLGLHAPELVFPGDEAQFWITDHVLAELGVPPDGSDFAAVHRAQDVLWGAWANAALLAAAGGSEEEVGAYLQRWALLRPSDVADALRVLAPPFGETYIFCYHRGWELLRPWLAGPDRDARARRLLTEQVHPADIRAALSGGDARATSSRTAPA